MAIFTGTSGTDTFVGTDGVVDEFRFKPSFLSSSDTVSGGTGASKDLLRLTDVGSITASQLVGVSGIEQINMFAGSSIDLTFHMLDTAHAKTITVSGSSGNDGVDGSLGTGSRMKLKYTALGGDDAFVGASGRDSVFIDASQLTIADSLSGGAAGRDTLYITSSGTLASDALTYVDGFETIKLNVGGDNITVLTHNVSTTGHGLLTIKGNDGNDLVDASTVTSGKIKFGCGAGDDTFYGGTGNDQAGGGAGIDYLYGNGGNDKLTGGDDDDYIYGGSGNDVLGGGDGNGNIYGGDGVDRISADYGTPFIHGGAKSDIITIYSSNSLGAQQIGWGYETEGGAAGDTIKGDLGHVAEGDIHLFFYQGFGEFDTYGAYDTEVFDDGTSPTGSGGPVDGADAVFYDGNGAGGVLGSASAVDSYFFSRYYVASGEGAFLAEMNADGSVTVYFDPDAYSYDDGTNDVVILAHIENYTGTISGLMGYFETY